MEPIVTQWISAELIDSIASTIIQSIWQGAIIALVTYTLMRWKGQHNPVVKYRLALLGILSLFVCTAATFLTTYISGAIPNDNSLASTVTEWSSTITIFNDESNTMSNAWIGYLWIIGVAIFSIKFVFDLGLVQYIRYTSEQNELTQKYIPRLKAIKGGLNSSVELKVSKLIQAPITIGFFKPIILFPLGMLNHLTTHEVESILKHEMAHIIRKDYLINIVQSIIEIVLFYHPLVWWLSKVAREEREYCCDDAAINNAQDALEYAQTLVKVQELALAQNQTLAMSFADYSLMNRIKRIMNLPKSNRNMREKLIAIIAVVALIVFASKDMVAGVTEKIWTKIAIENTEVPRETVALNVEVMDIDTLPSISKHSYSMTKSDDDGSITIKKENGKITQLEIDGKEIPQSQYDQYEEEIEEMEGGTRRQGNVWMFSDSEEIDMENLEEELERLGIEMEEWGEGFEDSFGKSMEEWGEQFGKSMEDWGEQFGNSFEWHFEEGDSAQAFSFVMPEMDEDVMNRLDEILGEIDVEGLRMLELDGLTNELSDLLEGFEFGEFDIQEFDNDGAFGRSRMSSNRTVEDKIGYELRKDRLIATGEVSEVELSGKHMKINGDKQPKNIWNKYKEIFEEASGITLSKDSKLKFNVEGKKTIKKSTSF